MHSLSFLQDLAVVMVLAGVVTVLFHRLKQPVVLGYILAGFLIGPHSPPATLIHDEGTINTLAELGVILLMFSLGLEFSLGKLKRVGTTALLAALMEIFAMGWIGYEVGQAFSWSQTDSLFLGAMLSMSSTTIIIKVLNELGLTKRPSSQLIFGILIVEDILGIAMIALLSGIAMTGTLSIGAVGLTLGKLGIFMAVVLVVGLLAVPRLVSYVARFRSNEMLLVTVLGLCFGVSLLATKLGYSVALGAFVIGAVVAECREIHRIEALVEPVRDMFSAVFFVAIGLLIDPRMLLEHWAPILAITAAVVVCKIVACSFGTFLGGHDARTSLRVGMSVAQIGEFSFIIASLGVTLGVTSKFLYPVAVAVSAITTLLTPYLIKASDRVADRYEHSAPSPLRRVMDVYTRWLGRLGERNSRNLPRKLVLAWSAQILLNLALIAAVFIGAVYIGAHRPVFLSDLGLSDAWLGTLLCFASMIVSLPMFLAVLRKLQALGYLIAEMRVSEALAGQRTREIRLIVSQAVPLAGLVGLVLYALVLSSTLLPPFRLVLVLLVVVAIVAWFLRRSFVKVYSMAQYALGETLAGKPDHAEDSSEPGTLPVMLREANLSTLQIAGGAPSAGKLIRELELRTRSGASIIGIERAGTNLLNPGPDDELCAGDHVLLLGAPAQIESARRLLSGETKR